MTSQLKEKLKVIRQNKTFLKEKYHVTKIGVFGSYARGEERIDSDIDILVDLKEPIGLLSLSALQRDLERLLGTKVDLGTKLKPAIEKSVLSQIIYA